MHDFAIRLWPRSIGAPAGDPVVPPSTKISALVEQGILKTAPAFDGSAYQKYVLTPKGRDGDTEVKANVALKRRELASA